MTNKYTACIIEDEVDASDYLLLILNNEFPNIEVKYVGRSIKDAAMYLLKEEHPDILFLDVQLQDGVIFDLFDKIGADKIHSQIIFTTAYDKFALPAIKANAVDYLLKPVSPLDFIIAVNKCITKIKSNKEAKIAEGSGIVNSTSSAASHHFINLPTLNGFSRISVNDIVYCEADANYTTIILANKERVVTSKNLKEYEKLLPENKFFRIHHKHVINTDFLTEYLKGKGGQVVLQNSITLDVSVRKKAELLDFLLKHQ